MKKCEPPRLLTSGSVYYGSGQYLAAADGSEGVYVGDWCIDADVLYHRHPDEVGYDMTGAEGVQEYDVHDRKCWKCGAMCPDGVWLAHRLQQLP